MTYNVFSGTLNPTHSLCEDRTRWNSARDIFTMICCYFIFVTIVVVVVNNKLHAKVAVIIE